MRQYKKKISVLIMCLIVFVSLDFFYTRVKTGVTGVTDSFAADDTGQDTTQNENEVSTENPCPECPECPDPAKVVLRGLEDKKTMIEKQQKALLEEKKELEMFEDQIDEKLESLTMIKKQIQADMAALTKTKTLKEQEKEAEYENKIGRLVKMYAGMKPKNAAQIVDKMNLEVAQEIFLRMRETSASQILTFVDSGKAAKISERLAFKRK